MPFILLNKQYFRIGYNNYTIFSQGVIIPTHYCGPVTGNRNILQSRSI